MTRRPGSPAFNVGYETGFKHSRRGVPAKYKSRAVGGYWNNHTGHLIPKHRWLYVRAYLIGYEHARERGAM